jgi:dextranase
LPNARLVFNNVNDFPTWATAGTGQDAVYVEVWPPHVGLEHLAQVVVRARREGAGKPVVVAAYQHVYDTAAVAEADVATRLTMATLFSHGASPLLCGEADRILVDPYYVRNHVTAPSTADVLHRYYDFAVAHAELLFDPGIADVTGSLAGGYNDDLDVSYPDVVVEHLAVPGTVWRRITRLPDGRYVMHLINLTGQPDTHWDAPRNHPADTGNGTLRIRRTGPGLPRVVWATPDGAGRLTEVDLVADGDHAVALLPTPGVWQVLLIDPVAPDEEEWPR